MDDRGAVWWCGDGLGADDDEQVAAGDQPPTFRDLLRIGGEPAGHEVGDHGPAAGRAVVYAGAGVAVPGTGPAAGGAVVEAHVAPVFAHVMAAGLLVQAVDVHGRHPVQPSLPFQAGEEPVGGVRPDTRLEERPPVEPVERFGVTPDERGVEHAEHPAPEPLGLEDPVDAGEVGMPASADAPAPVNAAT